jgi:hypothetical protein
MINTMHATAEGLLEWATQGRHYFDVKEDVTRALIPETLSVSDLYSAAIVDQSICDVWQQQDGHALSQGCSPVGDIPLIGKTIQEYGAGFQASATNYDEECERELEKEVEKEVEVERQLPVETPKSETDWISTMFFQYSSVADLPAEQVSTLAQVMNERSDRGLLQTNAISWPLDIWCTTNFAIPIETSGTVMNHLRPLDTIVAFDNGQVLLISERESDCLLSMLQGTARSTVQSIRRPCRFSLWNWSYFRLRRVVESPFRERTASVTSVVRHSRVMAALQLFNGETSFTDENCEALASLLQPATSKEASKLLVQIRGLSFMFPYSDLDKVTDEILSMART